MRVIEKIRDEISFDIGEKIESYLTNRYPILGVECEVEETEVEEDLGIASLTVWATVELEKTKEELEINIEEICKDISSQFKEDLEQNYTLQQLDVDGWVEEESEVNKQRQLTFQVNIKLEFEEEPIEWDVPDSFSIRTKRFPIGYYVTKSELSRFERIFFAYKGSEYADERLDLIQAIGRIFDVIVGSALMDKENKPGGLLFILQDAYYNLKTDMEKWNNEE